jgi:Zn-dependent protease
MTLFAMLFENPIAALLTFVGVVLAIGIHEFAHAYAATKLGDPTPKMQGRLTLNPIAHLDAIGTLMIVMVGIGWGKPVEFNPSYLKDPRRDAGIVAVAGPVSNILMALVATILVYLFQATPFFDTASAVLIYFITLNLSLVVFNMIPIEPLDGFKVVGALLPPHMALQWEETRKYGLYVLLLLLFTGVIDRFMFPIVNTVTQFLLSGL